MKKNQTTNRINLEKVQNQTMERINLETARSKADATYMDNDLLIIDGLKNLHTEESVQLDMIVALVCTRGRLQLDINGHTFHGEVNDLVVCPPNVFVSNYMVSPDFDSKIICLSYSALQRLLHVNKEVWDMMLFLARHPVFHLDAEHQVLLQEYYALVQSKLSQPQDLYRNEVMRALFQAVFYEVCAIIVPQMRAETGAEGARMRQGDLLMKRFVQLLAESQGRERSVTFYAERLCVTPKYLSMSCKASSGKTALQWIHEYTLEVIMQQLKYSDRSIKEISDGLGFSNISFFGKFVRAHLGVSPTEYRRRLAAAENATVAVASA